MQTFTRDILIKSSNQSSRLNLSSREQFLIIYKDIKRYSDSGYGVGMTADEFSERYPLLSIDHIYVGFNRLSSLYYCEPDNSVVPIVLSLQIYGDHRLPVGNLNDEQFQQHILDTAKRLTTNNAAFIRTYIFSLEDSFRVSVLSKYIKQAPPSPELYSLFTDIYRSTDYGFGVFDNIPYRFVVISNIHAIVKHRDIAFGSMLVKIANNIILCLLSQICFVFDNCNLQHTRNLPIGFAFFLFCHHSTKRDKQCQKDFLEHLCSFSVKAKGASANADAPLCVSCAFCKYADYLPLLFRRGMVSVFVSLQTVQV